MRKIEPPEAGPKDIPVYCFVNGYAARLAGMGL